MVINQQKKPSSPFSILLRLPVPWVFILTCLVGVVFQMIFPFNLHVADASFYVKIAEVILFVALEESVLRKDFGEEYKNYCAAVPRWI